MEKAKRHAYKTATAMTVLVLPLLSLIMGLSFAGLYVSVGVAAIMLLGLVFLVTCAWVEREYIVEASAEENARQVNALRSLRDRMFKEAVGVAGLCRSPVENKEVRVALRAARRAIVSDLLRHVIGERVSAQLLLYGTDGSGTVYPLDREIIEDVIREWFERNPPNYHSLKEWEKDLLKWLDEAKVTETPAA